MAPANLSIIAFFAQIVRRFVLAGLQRRPLVRAIAAQQHRHNNLLEECLYISGPGVVVVIAGNRFENSSDGLDPHDRKDRAKSYLRRIAALTGAREMDDAYVLDVSKMRFQVRDRYIKRLRDVTDPGCVYEETCFYSVPKGVPNPEEIATALLQLKNNPALFDRWAAQDGPCKADGQPFIPAQ
jgi:hypothetical protein